MKVQWQLVDIETGKKYLLIGEAFNLNLELLKVKLRRLWKGKSGAEPIEILVEDIRTDELKADMIYDYPAKLSELLKREAMDAIIEEIYDKMHEYGMKHHGESPTVLMLNHEHYMSIMEVKDYRNFVEIDYRVGRLKTIMGMEYQIRDDVKEIKVQ